LEARRVESNTSFDCRAIPNTCPDGFCQGCGYINTEINLNYCSILKWLKMGKFSPNSTSIVGAWKLIAFKTQKENEKAIYPFGRNTRGSIIYTDSGRFSVQIMRSDRPKFASGDQMKGTAEEIKANYEGCVSYYGSYEFDEENGFIIHHVEGSLFPNWERQGLKRFFELSGNRLKLNTPPTSWGGGENVATLIWERIL
jgi:hypothetical protein